MSAQQKKIKSNKKVRVFTVFLLLSLVFWLLIKLSGEYTTVSNVYIDFVDVPKDKLLQSKSENIINVKLSSVGFNLFRSKLSTKRVSLSLKNIKPKTGNTHYYITSHLTDQLDEKFSKSKIVSIKPDTLFFNLGKSISKKLKVIPNLNIQYQTGYNLSGELKVEPDFITVTGPETYIDTMLNVYTVQVNLSDLNSNIEEKINIIQQENKKVRYSEDEVKITGLVQKFTEKTLKTTFKVLNEPKDSEINTLPKEVSLIFQIGLSNFNKINTSDFEVVCDFKESIDNDLNYLIPKISKKPSSIKDVKIVPSKIEFLIKK